MGKGDESVVRVWREVCWQMYRRVLIANRADCAVRLIRGVHSVGGEAILASAMGDTLSIPRREADEVVITGTGRDAFEEGENLIEAALERGCEAILPGWGFLSESAAFAQQCRMRGIHFVGPTSGQLALFGDKLMTLKVLCGRLGLPETYISCGDASFRETLLSREGAAWALKRRDGGGGKGVYLCDSKDEVLHKLEALRQSERADAYFVEPRVSGRHIEFQLFGDGRGRVRVLGIRDCSEQVRCQKQREFHVAFDAESWLMPFVSKIEAVFSSLCYKSWGTLETLVDAENGVHLLEVNPRLQVEHGVTEMATGVDLVRAGLLLECGNAFEDALKTCAPIDANRVCVEERRYYASEPGPAPLPIFEGFEWPHSPYGDDPNIRIETGYQPGELVSGVFDGMVARIIRRSF